MNKFTIVYEDKWLIVVNKPSGLLVIPTPKGEPNTLTALLNRELDRRGEAINAYPCHRIDRDTSGLIIYAKGRSVQTKMMEQFKRRFVKKTYIAFVQGIVQKSFDILKGYVYNRTKARYEMMITRYKVLRRGEGFSILEVEPVTGRTNQIRIHLKEIGHPVVGESVYAFRKDFKLRFKRICLHSSRLRFLHPITHKRMDFLAPLPEDMKKFLKSNNILI